MRLFWTVGCLVSLGCLISQDVSAQGPLDPDQLVEQRLLALGEHRADLEKALESATEAEKPALQFLIAYLPDRDVGQVTGAQLLENVRLALKVRNQTEWQKSIPESIFLNDVLPYASLDESRDPWRQDFHERFWPLVADANSTTEAAQILNSRIFEILKVKYSTGRRRANQSPRESIEQGLASCSGLSILLVDACRAVGVPARIAGIPKWANKSGNHTWVEIWDGDWHFTGAAEFNPAGLNRTWFNADAAQAEVDNPMSSIYALSYKPTGLHFPMVWAPRDRTLHAINVTHRYTNQPTAVGDDEVRFLFRVWEPGRKNRIRTDLRVAAVDDPSQALEDFSRDESFDTNDIAAFILKRKQRYVLTISAGDNQWQYPFQAADAPQQLIEWAPPESRPGTEDKLPKSDDEKPQAPPAA